MRIFILWLVLFFVSPVGAQEILELTVEGVSQKEDKNIARQEIFDKVIQETSLNYIRDLIGAQKLEKNRALIQNKVLKNSNKYVLFIKGTPLAAAVPDTKISVSLKLSLKNLENLLLEEGLLYKTEGPPRVLPFVTFIDRTSGQTYVWWQERTTASPILMDVAGIFFRKLKDSLSKTGFYCMDPMKAPVALGWPPFLRQESMGFEESQIASELMGAQMVVRGQMAIDRSKIRSDAFRLDWKLTALQAGNGRVIGEVIRSYETESGNLNQVVTKKVAEVTEKMAADLSTQLSEAWKSGTFGSNLIRLSVRGPLDYMQLQTLKKSIQEQVKEVRTLKERLFEPGQIVFEVDATTNSQGLAQAFQGKKFAQFKVEVQDLSGGGLLLKVSP